MAKEGARVEKVLDTYKDKIRYKEEKIFRK